MYLFLKYAIQNQSLKMSILVNNVILEAFRRSVT